MTCDTINVCTGTGTHTRYTWSEHIFLLTVCLTQECSQAAWDRHLIAKASSQQHRQWRQEKKENDCISELPVQMVGGGGMTGVVHVE